MNGEKWTVDEQSLSAIEVINSVHIVRVLQSDKVHRNS